MTRPDILEQGTGAAPAATQSCPAPVIPQEHAAAEASSQSEALTQSAPSPSTILA